MLKWKPQYRLQTPSNETLINQVAGHTEPLCWPPHNADERNQSSTDRVHGLED